MRAEHFIGCTQRFKGILLAKGDFTAPQEISDWADQTSLLNLKIVVKKASGIGLTMNAICNYEANIVLNNKVWIVS